MRITHYLSAIDLTHGGVVRYILDLAAVQSRLGEQVTILTHDARDAPDSGPVAVDTLTPLGRGQRIRNEDLPRVRQRLAQSDVLHLHGVWVPAYRQLCAIARELGVPYVVTVHGMLDDWAMAQRALKKRLYLRLIGRNILDRAHAVICSGEQELRQAGRWFSNPRTFVLSPVMDLSPYRDPPGPDLARARFGANGASIIEDGVPIVLFLSRLHEKKGIELLIDAVALLRERSVPATLIIAGPGDAPYIEGLRRRIDEAGLSGCAHLVGNISGDDKLSLYSLADVFALPTHQENFGLVLVESLACQTPVVLTRGVGIWREIEDAGCGIAVPREPGPLASTIADLLADPKRRSEMGARGRQWVTDRLDETTHAKAFQTAYDRS